MGKIRVQDLARSMGLDKQDLVFKLKSIGVRVEGDEALIDSDIIQAILQGRRLPQPREVILRDDEAPPEPSPPQRGPAPRRPGPRPPRRSMIQRVERPIREIEVRPKDEFHSEIEANAYGLMDSEGLEQAADSVDPSLEATEASMTGAMGTQAAQELIPTEGDTAASRATASQATASQATASQATETQATEANTIEATEIRTPETRTPETRTAAAESTQPGATPARPASTAQAKSGKQKSVSQPAARQPRQPTKPAGRMAGQTTQPRGPGRQPPLQVQKPSRGRESLVTQRGKVAEIPKKPTPKPTPKPKPVTPVQSPAAKPAKEVAARPARPTSPRPAEKKPQPPSRSPQRPGPGAGRGAPSRGRRGGQDSRRRPGQRQDDRRPARIVTAVEQPRKEPVSARGHRRAEKRKEEPMRTHSGLQFKESRPEGPVTIAEGMTVREFAEKLGIKAKDLIRVMVMRGVMANINHVLDTETARSLAEEMGIEVMEVSFEEEVQLKHESNLDGSDAPRLPRAPVVTVMGHVDHGKTTLLDRIRSAKVAEGEAGGITQHIGAYHVDVGDKQVVFLDTPGHEAFTLMRARGASVTDIVILVVAADDSVMPQTIEAINHAKAGDVPIVVAINKIDKANANLDRVRKELADHGLMVEDWGGDIVSAPISALNNQGINELLELVTLTADLLELEASPSLPAHGAVLEARKETGRGIVATILVQNGTLRTGDTFVAGSTWGKVRVMTDDRGQRLDEAGPSTPVEVTGFTDVPGAGDLLQIMEDEAKARNIAEHRKQGERQQSLRPMAGRMTLEQLFSQNSDEVKQLEVIVKADVDGSVEVLRETLLKLSTEKVKVNILHAAVGAINNNDVIFASASNAIIVGFNIRPEKTAAGLADKEEVEILLHTVIYELQDELKRAMTGLLEPTFKEVHSGTAEVRNTFKIPKIGVVAGAHIVEGAIPRSAQVRLLRDNRVVWEGKISSLRRFKEDVSEVRTGFDCGIGLERFQDIKPGDSLEAFTREEVAPVL